MKLKIALLDTDGNVKQTVVLALEELVSNSASLNDVPINLEELGKRYVFLAFSDSGIGNLTFSMRTTPLLGHHGFYARAAEFEAYVDLRRLPATFRYRTSGNLFVQVILEG